MAVKIRLKRFGKKKQPVYRLVAANSTEPRDGKVLEEFGFYNPRQSPSLFEINKERVQYWISVGAQPTETVYRLLSGEGLLPKVKRISKYEGISKENRRKIASGEGAQETTKASTPEAKAAPAKAEQPEAPKAAAPEAAVKPVAKEATEETATKEASTVKTEAKSEEASKAEAKAD
ncbi:MAG: small subunit ribosomal protein S16, partial [Candidatus Marinamargulisbacteria bacterium]